MTKDDQNNDLKCTPLKYTFSKWFSFHYYYIICEYSFLYIYTLLRIKVHSTSAHLKLKG